MTQDANNGHQETLQTPKADEAALELMKQLIALASGVLALSATFVEHLQNASIFSLIVLASSWLALALSVFFGLQTISIIVKSRLQPEEYDWSQGSGPRNAHFSKYGFVLGLTLFAMFAFLSLIHPSAKSDSPIKVQIVK